ncbi:outer membrane beta-barrel protein [Taibaiella chishuiensis]|uniref:Outer membrane protein with beta-barrel domain n=1 Tax=Taibaiella chishuiensis TaxID=1434707 RepID=A0A2P8DD39_9BACT|nr:outer membrane beta-barrel protein [Taibaiella chishuiensis]PSK95141.1 outer membrane protein with beta-barrel domain [Taibaiella chishuiensis]
MKQALLFVAALAAALSAHAQSRRGLWVTPNSAIGLGGLVNKEYIPYKNNVSVYLGIGVDAGYMFGDHVGLFTGLNYCGYGYALDQSDRNNDRLLVGTQAMLELPLYLRFVSTTAGRFGFFTHVGFKYGFLVGQKDFIQVDGKRSDAPTRAKYNDQSFSPFVYLGMNIPAGRRVEMTLGPELTYQASNLFASGSSMRANYLNVGIKFGVGIKATR